ncbi:MAG: TonB-dependent receptor [bacterium]|nr:TonB-dependent receptor [bacterium]
MKRCLTAIGCWLLLLPGLALAGTTGSLKGTVSRVGDGNPVVGANVVLEGTTMGAATDINGVYYMANIPAGTYDLRITAVGYKATTLTDLRISADLLKSQDVALEETMIQGEEVTIFAERPLIELDKTSSVQITEAAQLQQLPVRGYNEIIKIQSGVQTYNYNSSNAGRYYNENTNGPRISVRGSREDEVLFNVDGVMLNDPYSGFVTFRVPDLAWDEFAFHKGNFSAEYGRFMSGVVNWTTKTGGERYQVGAELTSDAISPEDNRFDQTKYGVSLGGPIVPGNTAYRFFLAYEHGDYGDRGPSYVDKGAKEMNGTVWDAAALKLTNRLTDKMRLDLGLLYSDEEWNEYRHAYLFNLDHMPWYHDENLSFYGRFNHAVAADLNYTLTASYTKIKRFRGDNVFRDDIMAYGTNSMATYDPTSLFWQPGRMFRNFMKRQTEYVGLRADVQKLIGFDHDLRSGFDVQLYTLRYYEHGFPNAVISDAPWFDLNNFGYDELGNEHDGRGSLTTGPDSGDANYIMAPPQPVTMGYYVQDKIRLDYGIRFDLGLRWDYLDPDAQRFKNPAAPLGADQELVFGDDTEDVEAFHIWSPRLGVSFPVSEVTTFHFNYGRYTQFPSFYSYYVDYSYFERMSKYGGYHTILGNPNLEPTKTTSYEFGIDHGMGDYTALAFTAYYKSIRDYANVLNLPAVPSTYSTYFNMDRAITKGLEVEFRLKPYKRFSGAVNYTISWANGTGSSNNGNDRVAWTGSDPPKFTNPLVYDRRHHLSGVILYEFAAGDGPRLMGWPLLERSTFGFNLDVASGRPYTKKKVYNEITLGANFPENERAVNAANIDWSYQLDFRFTRTFKTGPVDLGVFLNVINVLDAENFVSVWESSGDAGTTYWLETSEGQAWMAGMAAQGVDGEGLYRLREDDPNNWNVPRMLQVGLTVNY